MNPWLVGWGGCWQLDGREGLGLLARPGDVAARLSWPKLASGRAEGADGPGSLCAQSQSQDEVLAGAGVYMVLF